VDLHSPLIDIIVEDSVNTVATGIILFYERNRIIEVIEKEFALRFKDFLYSLTSSPP